MINEDIGKRIRQLRESRNQTREELAEKSEISTKFLYEIEMGKKGLSADTLLKISKALSCNCDYLLTGKNPENDKLHNITRILEGFEGKQLQKVERILKLIRDINDQKQ